MKIGLVCPYNIAKGGGVQEGVLAIQHELQARGHEAKIITPLPKLVEQSEWPDVIFIGTATDIRSPLATTTQFSYRVPDGAIEAMMEREKFDILHFHEPWVPMMSRRILSKSDSINVGTFHARLPDTTMSKTLEAIVTPYTKPLIKYLHGLTAVSDAAGEYVKTLTHRHIEIIPNGINLAKFSVLPKHHPTKHKTILYVGRLEKRKGIKYLIKAFAQIEPKNPNVHLVLVGDGPDREKLEQMAIDLKLHNVTFKGYVEESEKLKLMAAADVFCSPALYGESFGIVLLEAMAAGVPTVAGHNPGYSTVMRDRGRISLVNPDCTEDFARRLLLFLEDEGIRNLWLDWSNEYVQQFDYPRVVDKYEALYNRLLRSRS